MQAAVDHQEPAGHERGVAGIKAHHLEEIVEAPEVAPDRPGREQEDEDAGDDAEVIKVILEVGVPVEEDERARDDQDGAEVL